MNEPEAAASDEQCKSPDGLAPRLAPPDVHDPVIEAYKKDVDRTLIRENLKLTHEQRLMKLQSYVESALRLRGAARRKLSSGS